MRILVLNGPNLNLLGQRDPAHYGESSLEDIIAGLRELYPDHEFEDFQSNHEGELVDALHRADRDCDAAILNAGAYTHSSIALGDAVEALSIPVLEVHLSNVYGREGYRRRSHIAPHAAGIIVGMGADGYRLAVEHLLKRGVKGS